MLQLNQQEILKISNFILSLKERYYCNLDKGTQEELLNLCDIIEREKENV